MSHSGSFQLDSDAEVAAGFRTLVKIAAVTGLEFAINVTPAGKTPRLASKAVKDTPAREYGGGSLLVAAR